MQGTLADILDPVLGNARGADAADGGGGARPKLSPRERRRRRKFESNRRKNARPLEIRVAGRTDRGVSAIGQVCRVRTLREIDGVEEYVKDLVNGEMRANHGGGIRITSVESVGDAFHPSFGASCRAYAYLVDLGDDEQDCSSTSGQSSQARITRSIVPTLDRMLQSLQGRELDYFALSHGKVKTQTTLCTLSHARARIVELKGDDDAAIDDAAAKKRQAICFELVGNRFLRRMVRLLVATALREAHRCEHEDCNEDALLEILSARDRSLRSRAAPPDGLIFIGAGF